MAWYLRFSPFLTNKTVDMLIKTHVVYRLDSQKLCFFNQIAGKADDILASSA